jgi:hypothetical protein
LILATQYRNTEFFEKSCNTSRENRKRSTLRLCSVYGNRTNNNQCNDAKLETEKYKEYIKKVKAERPDDKPLTQEMIHQSQFMKAELHRIKKRYSSLIAEKQTIVDNINNEINLLKQQRRQKSDYLQRWLFKQFIMKNANSEKKDLIDIFYNYNELYAISLVDPCTTCTRHYRTI